MSHHGAIHQQQITAASESIAIQRWREVGLEALDDIPLLLDLLRDERKEGEKEKRSCWYKLDLLIHGRLNLLNRPESQKNYSE